MGNVTGANATRKAAMQTQDAINAAKTEQKKERLRQVQLQEANERFSKLSPEEQGVRIEQARKEFVNVLGECLDTMPKKKKA